MSSQNKNKTEDKEVAWWQPALMLFFRLSVWIVVPVILATYLGKALDNKFATDPLIFISLVGFSFLVSMFGIVKEAMKEFKKAEKKNKEKE